MKNLFKLAIAVLFFNMAVSAASAQDCPVADIKAGPWVTNVSGEAFNVLWTSNYRTLSYVEVAPDDGTDFDACERPRFYQTVSGRRVIDTFHDVRITGLEPGKSYQVRAYAANENGLAYSEMLYVTTEQVQYRNKIR